jgi:tetratricopeptide (TPR) repeat protein
MSEKEQHPRHLRVFISSTFRDMHPERDHMVKVVFPQLRLLCESRGVTWGEVDLRWGVTDEAAAEGKVLPICLEEINRCRPFFIGLLGERYGWVPDSISPALLEKEAWLREQITEKKSVTELEILHGVLRNSAMAGHAFFYFRDPGFVNNLPPEMRKDYISDDEETAEKLSRLKQLIRDSGQHVRENYPDPKALGELVLSDLTGVINQLWPEGSQPDPLDREKFDHAAYAQSRERVYIGRPGYFARLDAHAEGKGDQPLLILGESGSGKSALLANWAAQYRQAHPDILLLEHYIGATPSSADWAAMLRRILSEFKRQLGLQQEIPDNPIGLRNDFPNWLHMAAARCQKAEVRRRKSDSAQKGAGEPALPSGIILVLDALNQLEDRDGAQELLWLPPVIPENVQLIVSTLPGKPLNEIKKRGWPILMVEPLSLLERRELIRTFLGQYGRQLSPSRIEHIAVAQQSANPLYLCVLLNELRLFGVHERLDERIDHYLQAAAPNDLYGKIIARWEEDYEGDTDLVGDSLSLLWAARRGLSETELLDALGHDGQPLPRNLWSPLFLAMSDALVSRGGLLTFAHDFLRSATCDAYMPTEGHKRLAHEQLADYFQRQPNGTRRIDELPWQLLEANEWLRLYSLLADNDFVISAFLHNQFDVRNYWIRLESASQFSMTEAYRMLLEFPERTPQTGFLIALHGLLVSAGHAEDALGLGKWVVQHLEKESPIAFQGGRLADLDTDAKRWEAAGRLVGQQQTNEQFSATISSQISAMVASGRLQEAWDFVERFETICREQRQERPLVTCLLSKADILRKRGDNIQKVLSTIKEATDLCIRWGWNDLLSTCLGNQALCLQLMGDLTGALGIIDRIERTYRETGDIIQLANALSNRASILMSTGHRQASYGLLDEAESLYVQGGDIEGLQVALGTRAVALLKDQDFHGAIEVLRRKADICRKAGLPEGLSYALWNLAVALSSLGRKKEALSFAEETYTLAKRHGYTSVINQIEPELASLREDANKPNPWNWR